MTGKIFVCLALLAAVAYAPDPTPEQIKAFKEKMIKDWTDCMAKSLEGNCKTLQEKYMPEWEERKKNNYEPSEADKVMWDKIMTAHKEAKAPELTVAEQRRLADSKTLADCCGMKLGPPPGAEN